MPSLLLADRSIVALMPPSRTAYHDTHMRGLVLRVSGPTRRNASRARTWYFVYRNGGPQEWLPIGTYPAMSLKEARDRVKAERRRIDDGIDPAVANRTPSAPPAPEKPVYTFAMFVPVYIAFQKGRTKGWENEQGKITRHLLPVWGDRELKSLTRADVHERLDALTTKGLSVGVNRIQALMSRIFTVALDRGLVDHHPAARIIKRFPDTPRERVLSDAELRALWAGLEARPGAAADAMKLRLLLGQRGGETAGMTWSELDLEAGIWSLSGSRTKNKTPHVIALPPMSLAIVKARRELLADEEPRVFPGLTLMCDAHKDLSAIRGGAYEWKDLRRTVATRLGDLGYEDSFIGRVLNHKRYTVTAKHYNHARYLRDPGGARGLGSGARARAPRRADEGYRPRDSDGPRGLAR